MNIDDRLGPYQILAELGRGGMGAVYRARDTKLGREVAIKVVLESMIADAERAARFRREAQVLASLNHPNIATLYGMEEAAGPSAGSGQVRHFLVMELVDGEDLSERIARGALPLSEALPLARQIADALEAAHDAGIIHRDLKPANIKVKADGTVKVLDFGLARTLDPDPVTRDASTSPTLTARATQMGMIIGTAAYMSPEQARGRAVDKRADIWAFGVVLYEMLTGRRAFDGDDISITLANVLKDDISWQTLPPDLPPSVRRLLRRCLEKEPRRRLSAISDARLEIDEANAPGDRDGAASNMVPAVASPAGRRSLPYAVGALGLVAGGVGVALWLSSAGASTAAVPVSRFELTLPADAPFVIHASPGRAIALSADGTQIAYTTGNWQADTRIRVRRLDAIDIRSIPGTEKGRAPFFSHDGLWVAFFDYTERTLKKVSVSGGGQPVPLQRGLANAGWSLGSWCEDGRIVFDTWNGGLRVVGGDGSGQRALTEPKDEWHLDPQPLPGPCRVLFYTYRTEGYAIHAISADGGTPTRVLDNASHGRYLESGHLLFVRDSALHLAPFDAERMVVTGPALPASLEVAPDWHNVGAPVPQLGVSRNGTLVYAPRDGALAGSPIVSVGHDGQPEDAGVASFVLPTVSLAPNGEDLALSGRRAGRALIDTINLTHKGTADLVDLGMVDMPTQPVWTLDKKAILYSRYGPFEGEILRHELDGRSPDTVVARISGTWICPWSMSPDGRWLIVSRYSPETLSDLLLVDLAAAPAPSSVTTFVAGPDEEGLAAISPNGQWVAYTADRGEGRELIIDKFPEGGQKIRVAPTAAAPVWSPSGDEIYFTSLEPKSSTLDMLAVRVTETPRLSTSAPRRLFSGNYKVGSDTGRSFTLTGDGKRFLMVKSPQGEPPSGGTGYSNRLMVVQNWFAELRGAGRR